MAARARASFTDDDSISDHLTLEMVRINAPQTTTMTSSDPDEQMTLNDSAGTTGLNTPATNDFLSTSQPSFIDGTNREYEIPNLYTYKKVIQRFEDDSYNFFLD